MGKMQTAIFKGIILPLFIILSLAKKSEIDNVVSKM